MLPFVDRVAAPVLSGLTQVGQRFSPAGRVEQMRVMLRRAGRPDVDTDRYLAIRVLSILASPLVAIVAWRLAVSQDEMLRVAITGLAVDGCTVLPSRKLRTEVEAPEVKFLSTLTDCMDLLEICSEAGIGR